MIDSSNPHELVVTEIGKRRKERKEVIDNILSVMDIPDSGKMNERVKDVIVILSGSRNGSSMLKSIVSQSPDVAYLAGEEEPYLILSENGYAFNSYSDKLHKIDNKQLLLNLIFNELGVNEERVEYQQLLDDLYNRILVQIDAMEFIKNAFIPETSIFTSFHSHVKILKDNIYSYFSHYWESIYGSEKQDSTISKEQWKYFLSEYLELIVGKEFIGLYDGYKGGNFENTNNWKIEEPPFVLPRHKRRITEDDLETKKLLFKTPQDCYRYGMFEKLFPNAKIKYIHLTRNFASSVNGLMDGWLSESGFFAQDVRLSGEELKINGYSDVVKNGNIWWKFDMFPEWETVVNYPLENVCLAQWYFAHNYILNIAQAIEIPKFKFEDILENKKETLDKIAEYFEISIPEIKELPQVMVTEKPKKYRWLKRDDIIQKMKDREDVKMMMKALGYEMIEKTWI